MALYTHHLPSWKKDEVADIKKNAKQFTLIGLVDIYGIPAQQVQQIRRNLRGIAVIKVTRNTLIKHAFEEIGGDVKGLTKYVSGHSAIIFTNDNPFKLFKQLEKTKTKMAAKAGEKAPEDIVIEKGPTSFRRVRLSASSSRQVFPQRLKAGRSNSGGLQDRRQERRCHLGKAPDDPCQVDIKPMDVGLALQVAYHDGDIFEPSVLAVDETVVLGQIRLAGLQAFNLSVNAAIPTKDTMGAILTKACPGCARSCC